MHSHQIYRSFKHPPRKHTSKLAKSRFRKLRETRETARAPSSYGKSVPQANFGTTTQHRASVAMLASPAAKYLDSLKTSVTMGSHCSHVLEKRYRGPCFSFFPTSLARSQGCNLPKTPISYRPNRPPNHQLLTRVNWTQTVNRLSLPRVQTQK